MAYKAAAQCVRSTPGYDVPMHLRNAPTGLMSDLGYGEAYHYAHDHPEGYVPGEHYFPMEMAPESFYQPVKRGLEIKIEDKLKRLRFLDASSKWAEAVRDRGSKSMISLNGAICIAFGGAAGALARYAVAVFMNRWGEQMAWSLPLGTLVVNLLGSFLLAVYGC